MAWWEGPCPSVNLNHAPQGRISDTTPAPFWGQRVSQHQFVKYLLKTYLCTRHIEPLTEREGAWGGPGLRLCLRCGKSRLPWSSALVRRNAMGTASPQGIRPPLASALTMAAPDLRTPLALTTCM